LEIAAVSTAIVSVLWENVFYSNRFHTENSALIFELLAILILFKCYLKKEKFMKINPKYSLIFILLFSILSILFRPGNILFFPGMIAFILLVNSRYFLNTNKKLLISSIVAVSALFLFIVQLPNLAKISLFSTYYHPTDPIAWNVLNVFSGFYVNQLNLVPSILFYSFLVGLGIMLFKTYVNYDKLNKMKSDKEDLELKSDIFNLLIIASVLGSFIFLLRTSNYEYRWFFPLLTGMLSFTSKGIINLSELASSLLGKKEIATLAIVLLTLLGVYSQIVFVNPIVTGKLSSYGQVKEAGLWLKSNSLEDDVILAQSVPQLSYYSERKIQGIDSYKNETEFENYLEDKSPNFLIISGFENHPRWIYEWVQKNQERLPVVKAYYLNNQQPILVIYSLEKF